MGEISPGANYIFVGGPPRSGTTLVQNVLDSHPDVAGTSEFLHLPDIVTARNRIQDSVRKDWIPDFCDKASADAATAAFIDSFLSRALKKFGTRFLSEKTPGNIVVFKELAELLPGSKFIMVIRDPRAIVASMLSVGKRARSKGIVTQAWTRDLFSAINYVRACYEKGAEFLSEHSDRCIAVSYEGLVERPEQTCRELVDFLGLPWVEEMLRPGDVEHPGEKAITQNSGEIWYDSATYNRNVDASGVDKWRDQLSSTQQAIIARSFRRFAPLEGAAYDFKETGGRGGARWWIGGVMASLSQRRLGRRMVRFVANS